MSSGHGAAAVVRRSSEVRVRNRTIPAGANKGVFLLAPLVTCTLALAAWAVIPVSAGLGDCRYQRRRSLRLRDLARCVRHHHGGWASIRNIRSFAALRSAAQMVSYEVPSASSLLRSFLCAGCSSSRPLSRRRTSLRHVRLVLATAAADVRGVFRLGVGGDQRRSIWWKRSPSWSRASWSNTARHRICFLLGEHVAIGTCAPWHDPVPGGWLPPFQVAPFTWVPGVIWFAPGPFMFFLFAMARPSCCANGMIN